MKGIIYAGFARRLGAFCIDYLFFGAMISAMTFVLMFPVLLFGMMSMFSMATATIFTVLLWLSGVLLFFALHWLYFAGFEASSLRATPGKLAVGLCVCDMQGQRISLRQSTIRYAAHYLSGLLFYFGYLISFFTAKRQTLHDLISKCLVVHQNSLPERTMDKVLGARPQIAELPSG